MLCRTSQVSQDNLPNHSMRSVSNVSRIRRAPGQRRTCHGHGSSCSCDSMVNLWNATNRLRDCHWYIPSSILWGESICELWGVGGKNSLVVTMLTLTTILQPFCSWGDIDIDIDMWTSDAFVWTAARFGRFSWESFHIDDSRAVSVLCVQGVDEIFTDAKLAPSAFFVFGFGILALEANGLNVNALLNWGLIHRVGGTGLGVLWAAWATSLTRAVELVLIGLFLYSRKNKMKETRPTIQTDNLRWQVIISHHQDGYFGGSMYKCWGMDLSRHTLTGLIGTQLNWMAVSYVWVWQNSSFWASHCLQLAMLLRYGLASW